MFRKIRHAFAKVRVIFNALRAGLYGFVLVCAGWLFLAPPSQTEIDRLSLPLRATAQHEAVRAHRMAKLVVLVANDRIYGLVARRGNAGLSAEQIRNGMVLAAAGTSLRVSDAELGADAIQKNSIRPSGAKFVTARTTP